MISMRSAVARRADGAEALALEPDVRRPTPRRPLLDDVGAGVGREVDVGVGRSRSRKASRTVPPTR